MNTPSRVAPLILLAGLAAPALAQDRLPEPPPAPTPSVTERLRVEGYEDFLAAYKRAGSPRLLVYTDIVSVTGSAQKTLNDLGTVSRLGNRVQDLFAGPEVVLVNLPAGEILSAEARASLRSNDEFGAARIVGQRVGADVVVFVRLIEQSGRSDGASYAGTYVIADLSRGTNIGSNTFDMTPEKGQTDFTSRRMGEYARAIARAVVTRFIEQFPAASGAAPVTPAAPAQEPISTQTPAQVPPPLDPARPQASAPAPQPVAPPMAYRRFTIRVVGDYEDQDLLAFRDALRSTWGIRPDSVMLRQESDSNSGALTNFELMAGIDTLELRSAVRRVAIERLGMEANVIESREGLISLKLEPVTFSSRQRMLAGGAWNGRNEEARLQMLRAYETAGRPRIAIMVNNAKPVVEGLEADAAIAGAPTQTSENAVNVVVSPRVVLGANAENNSSQNASSAQGGAQGGNDSSTLRVGEGTARVIVREELKDRKYDRAEDRLIDTAVIEDQLIQRFVDLRLDVRDLSGAQQKMLRARELGDKAWDEAQLASELGKAAGADVVVSGLAKVQRSRADQSPQRVTYTLRAFRVSDGRVIGAASVARDLRLTNETIDQALTELVSQATGKIVEQMTDTWTGGR
jgi:hypothetical protein